MRLRPVTKEDVPLVVSLVRETLAEFGLTFGEGSATDEQLMRLPEVFSRVGVPRDSPAWIVEIVASGQAPQRAMSHVIILL